MKYIPYIIAGIFGLFLRSIIAAINGWEYAINGVDLLCAIAAITAVWSFKATFLQKSQKKNRR